MDTKLTSPNPSKGGEPAESTDFVENIENEKQLPGYITANLQNYRLIKDGRENLKDNPTEAEKLIWEYLRNKKTGHKIRRQHVIDNYIADFVCLPKKVVIEIDGEIHIQQKEYDAFRTNTLNEKGYKVIRFTNAEVLANPALVATKIKEILDSRKTLESNNQIN